MKKTVIITTIIVLITLSGLLAFVNLTSEDLSQYSYAQAEKGPFEIVVSATGQLDAENSVDINGPDIVANRNFRATGIKILDLVPEGTIVKKGDYIASLDRTNFDNRLKDEMENLQNIRNDLQMALLDSAVTLTGLRDEIKNQDYALEEAEILLDQSEFEPPAVQYKAELAVDRQKRTLEQQKKTYYLRYRQTLANIRNLQTKLERQDRIVTDLQDVLAGFTIIAPSDGMLIYKKDRLGNKIEAGSTIYPWFPAVATLPDLSSMLSKIYVNEIEINKVREGQPVLVTVDALHGKAFKGTVASIANIGEILPNSDSKVFEVLVKIDDNDPALRPSMTTGNRIITKSFQDVVYVPIESVQAGSDNIPFVYTRDGRKQIVVPGESNDKNIIIEQGLTAGTSVWIVNPDEPSKFKVSGEELIAVNEERAKTRQLEMNMSARKKSLLTGADQNTGTINGGGGQSTSSEAAEQY